MINIRNFLGLAFYTSELDQFLKEFDKKNPQLSHSQKKEIAKYQRIFSLRDHPDSSLSSIQDSIWEKF